MKNKKVMAILMASVLTMSALLSACGSAKETAGGNTATVAEPDADGKVGVMNAEGLPLVDPAENYSFSVFVDNTSKIEDLVMLPILEEQTGVKVEWQAFPYEIAKEKFSLALSSGDYADAIGGWCLSESDLLTYGVNMGIFVPLEDIFEKYCPNIQALLELPGVRETMTAPDGHIYAIPYVLGAPKVDFNPYINQRWLDNLGLEMPKTTEELKEVLKAFKAQDANGNGDPNDEIPFSADPNNRNKITLMFGAFGESVDKYGMTMHGDKLEFAGTSDAYKEGVKFFADLYKEGLVDNEIFTQDLATWKAKGGQDLYGCSIAYGSGDFLPYEPGTTPDFTQLPVLSSPQCDKPVWLANTYGTDVLKNQLVITDKAKNPEIICRWFDNLFTLDNSAQVNWGPIDKVIFADGETADGLVQYRKIDTTTWEQEERDKYEWANLFPQSIPRYIPANYKLKEDLPPFPEKDTVDAAYASSLINPVPKYWVDPDSAAELSDLQTALEAYMSQKLAQWISGQGDVEKEWEEYKAYLSSLGLERYVELRKTALGQTE